MTTNPPPAASPLERSAPLRHDWTIDEAAALLEQPAARQHQVLDALVAAEGESVPGPILQIGNTNTRVRFSLPPGEFGQRWTETGSTHHFALGVGHQLQKIEKLAKLLDLELEVVCR